MKPTTPDRKAVESAVHITIAIAETIRDMGSVPSGHLYAILMSKGLTLETYESMLTVLIRNDLVKRDGNHLLTWVGPHRKETPTKYPHAV